VSMRIVVDNGPGLGRRQAPARGFKNAAPVMTLRAAQPADAPALLALIAGHLDEGHLLPRSLGELVVHAPRFVVAVQSTPDGERIVGCAELAPLSSSVAEVRSLVVGRDARKLGLGLRMVDELGRRARIDGFDRLCAFAHDPRFFVRLGFSIVPHTWVPEKIAHDCSSCPLFRQCGQYAIVLDLRYQRTNLGTGEGTSAGTRGTSVVNRRGEPS
jgi:N-acetylglutamate synthase-like GNAT family acetyltransferase